MGAVSARGTTDCSLVSGGWARCDDGPRGVGEAGPAGSSNAGLGLPSRPRAGWSRRTTVEERARPGGGEAPASS